MRPVVNPLDLKMIHRYYPPYYDYYAGEDYYRDENDLIRVRKYVDVYYLGCYNLDLYDIDLEDFNSPDFKKVRYKCYDIYDTKEDEWKHCEKSFSRKWKKLTHRQLIRAINLEKKKIELIRELKK